MFVRDQRIHRSQRMIQPQSGEPYREIERRFDMDQAFLEIGAILLGDHMNTVRPKRARALRGGIHIAQNRPRRAAKGQGMIRPTIGADQIAAKLLRQGEICLAGTASAQ